MCGEHSIKADMEKGELVTKMIECCFIKKAQLLTEWVEQKSYFQNYGKNIN